MDRMFNKAGYGYRIKSIFFIIIFSIALASSYSSSSSLAQSSSDQFVWLPLITYNYNPSNALPPADATNLALEQNASQSSEAYSTSAAFAVDGKADGDFGNGSVALTDVEPSPWWQVDLGDSYELEQIDLWGRTDCCTDELNNFYIFISATDFGDRALSDLIEDSLIWKQYVDGNSLAHLAKSTPTTGRYVRIQMVDEKSLALAEVKVYGHPISSGTPILQIGRESEEAKAVEGSTDAAIYTIRRYGATNAASIPFTINASTARDIALRASQHLAQNPQPGTLSFFPNNQVFCAIAGIQENDFPAEGVASSNDYILTDEDGNEIIDSIQFDNGETKKKILIKAVSDSKPEVPEIVTISLSDTNGYKIQYTNNIEVKVTEGEGAINSNSLLFVATMRAEGSADTTATGLATIRLADDNSFGMVSMSFAGLTSEQTAAHIHIANPDSGPIAFSLPLGQLSNVQWGIKAAQFIETDQAMLDTLIGGGLYINVHSGNYPAGEIKGTLSEQDGSDGGDDDYPAPDYEILTGEALTRDIVRFLRQSTFGPTPSLVADLENRIAAENGDRIIAYSKWLDEQMGLESPSHLDYYLAQRLEYISNVPSSSQAAVLDSSNSLNVPFYGGWFTPSVYAKAQVRERIAFALSQIFVVSSEDSFLRPRNYGIAAYNDLLKEHAFGSYESLIYDVSKSPTMGNYLSHIKNQMTYYDEDGNLIASPDENYAREILQLFSIGMVELNPDYSLKLGSDGLPITTYDQKDVTELARVFTGWSYAVQSIDSGQVSGSVVNTDFEYRGEGRPAIYHPYLVEPMISFADNGKDIDHRRYVLYRDPNAKTVLGQTIPEGQTAEEDLAQVMTILANHPNTAPFISYRLIQRLVTSNPSAGYVFRVSTAFTESNGDLGETVKAILLDPEARNLEQGSLIGAGRVQEPLVRVMNLMRLFQVEYTNDATYPLSKLTDHGLPVNQLSLYDDDASRILMANYTVGSSTTAFGQAPLSAPSVFNWFQPDFSPAGPISAAGLVAPEFQLMSESIEINYYNVINSFAFATPDSHGPKGYAPEYGGTQPRPILRDLDTFLTAYMDVMDTNKDGIMNEEDAAYEDDAAVRAAVEATVDSFDLYVCDGWFKENGTGDSNSDPRELIIDAVAQMLNFYDGKGEENVITARDTRIREILLVMFTAPQCMVQK